MGRQKPGKPGRSGPRGVGGGLLVRDALQEDIPGVCATMPEAFGLMGGAPWTDPAYVAEGLAVCAAGLSGRQRVKVALLDATVVGCSYSGLALGPDGQTAHREIGLIHGVAVRPDSRRPGAASALLTACEEYLGREGARVMLLEARPGAVDFFRARGYQAAAGPAVIVRSSAGMFLYPQSVPSTTLMRKNCQAQDEVVPVATRQGTVLEGVGGQTSKTR
ncbi:GNAT family N-acetyltransferase [Streptacidiphilus sp. EB103A]|uniref:GNAT family N-acetyltransferase n=1 Tax=Streptacidiphilus sp. EB103A TaxID=3156275 RepID=UPI0035171888